MTDDWDFYFCNVEDKIASIFVDLGIGKTAPLPALNHTAYVRLYMRKPRDDGLSSEEEYKKLVEIEDKLTEGPITKNFGFVGRCTTNGIRDFVYYVCDPHAWKTAVTEVLREFPEYKYQADYRLDAEWDTYISFLKPGERDLSKIANRKVCEALEQRGDLLTAPREIDYWVYLRDENAVAAFTADAVSEGFQLRHRTEPGGGEYPVGVQLWRVDVPSYTSIDEPTLLLFDLAKAHRGSFDGWECPVLKHPESIITS